MTARDLRRLLRRRGCIEVRQVGSHLTIRCDACLTTIAVHTGDIPAGTLRKIEGDLEPCLEKGWLRR
ncbi:MAG: type II toxin-antitoxin system HicA family toxin [Acidimicrobiales bacterium]